MKRRWLLLAVLGLLGPDVALARKGHLLILQTHPLCGDGQIQLPEQCDDGNVANGDGCSSTCTIQQQYTCCLLYTSRCV